MKTKREVLEVIAKYKGCYTSCYDCPYSTKNTGKYTCIVEKLMSIGAMAILRQNKKRRVFNPDKILTCVTADKARVGMKGYFGDDLAGIKSNFEKNNLYELSGVYKENYPCRFINKRNEYALFYPIDDEEEEW